MKRVLLFALAALFLGVLPLFAQEDMFKDVPSDHWAYDAVASLKSRGLVQGYPGDIYIGKRNLSRYEFAMVVAKLVNWIDENYAKKDHDHGTTPGPGGGISQADLDKALAGYAKVGAYDAQLKALQDDVASLRKLINEFRGDLDRLGVKVTDIETKLADLTARVEWLEKEADRFRTTGIVNLIGKAVGNNSRIGSVVDSDNRLGGSTDDSVIRTEQLFTDFDLNIVGKVSDNTKANLTLNYGSYLPYLRTLDTFAGPTFGGPAIVSRNGLDAALTVYNANVEAMTGLGKLTIGRQPLQISPYTLKKIDVDSLTTNWKTDDGNYSFDGFKLNSTYGGVDVLGFFGRNNNAGFQNGFTTAPLTGGAFDNLFSSSDLNGSTGITSQVTQSAGVNVSVPTPLDGKVGLTYLRSWSSGAWSAGRLNQAEVMAFDLSLPISFLKLDGSVGQSNVLSGISGRTKLDWRNAFYDAKLSADIAGFGIGVGYKRIGENYIAPGNWGKIGRWANPRMVKGFYGDLKYGFGETIKLKLGANILEFTDTKATAFGTISQDDKIQQLCGGLEWQLSGANSIGLDVERVSYPDWQTRSSSVFVDDPVETYITLGWNHKLNEDAGIKVGYQMISYDRGAGALTPASVAPAPYPNDYRGGVGVVQLGVSF